MKYSTTWQCQKGVRLQDLLSMGQIHRFIIQQTLTEKVLMLPKESFPNRNESKRKNKRGHNLEFGYKNNDLLIKANKAMYVVRISFFPFGCNFDLNNQKKKTLQHVENKAIIKIYSLALMVLGEIISCHEKRSFIYVRTCTYLF